MTETTAPTLRTLPEREIPYVVGHGGGRAHLLIDQVGRCLASAEETSGAMSMMTLEGPPGPPIPLHYHDSESEFFFCHRGTMQLYLDDESRILHPGDFGFVPPGAVHSYQLHGAHSGFIGPITPGGWDRFFDLTGIPYDGAAPFPVGFTPEVPFAKFGQAEHAFKMHFLPDHPYASARADTPDDTLPGARQPYFLRAGAGPRYRFAGALATSLATSAETAGTVAMTTYAIPRGAGVPAHAHERTAEGLYVLEGAVRVWLDGAEHLLSDGDYASIPPGVEHRWEGAGFFSRVLEMTSPGGLEALLGRAGQATELTMCADCPATSLSAEALAEAADELDVVLP